MYHFQSMFLIEKGFEMDTVLFLQTVKNKYHEHVKDKVCDSIAFILNEMVQQPIYAKLLEVPTEQLSIPAECLAAEAAGYKYDINYNEKPYIENAPFYINEPYEYIDKDDKYTMAKRILSNSAKYGRDPLNLRNYITSIFLVPDLDSGNIKMLVSGSKFVEWFVKFINTYKAKYSGITQLKTKSIAENERMYETDWSSGMTFKLVDYDDIDNFIWNDPNQNGNVQICYAISQSYFAARAAIKRATNILYERNIEQNRLDGLTQSILNEKLIGLKEDTVFCQNYRQLLKDHTSVVYHMTKEIYNLLLTATLDLRVNNVAKTMFDIEKKEHKNPLQMRDLLGYKFKEYLTNNGKNSIFLSEKDQKIYSERFDELIANVI